MSKKGCIALLPLILPGLALAQSEWALEQNTLTYHVSHPLHQTDGVSHAARGKGVCHDAQCDFLVAVPVKTFDSGDSNRDLHMVQVTRGAAFPMATVRTRLPESASSTTFHSSSPRQGNEIRVSGTIPATLADFKIDPPTLLTMPVKNEIPVRVEMTWHPAP